MTQISRVVFLVAFLTFPFAGCLEGGNPYRAENAVDKMYHADVPDSIGELPFPRGVRGYDYYGPIISVRTEEELIQALSSKEQRKYISVEEEIKVTQTIEILGDVLIQGKFESTSRDGYNVEKGFFTFKGGAFRVKKSGVPSRCQRDDFGYGTTSSFKLALNTYGMQIVVEDAVHLVLQYTHSNLNVDFGNTVSIFILDKVFLPTKMTAPGAKKTRVAAAFSGPASIEILGSFLSGFFHNASYMSYLDFFPKDILFNKNLCLSRESLQEVIRVFRFPAEAEPSLLVANAENCGVHNWKTFVTQWDKCASESEE